MSTTGNGEGGIAGSRPSAGALIGTGIGFASWGAAAAAALPGEWWNLGFPCLVASSTLALSVVAVLALAWSLGRAARKWLFATMALAGGASIVLAHALFGDRPVPWSAQPTVFSFTLGIALWLGGCAGVIACVAGLVRAPRSSQAVAG